MNSSKNERVFIMFSEFIFQGFRLAFASMRLVFFWVFCWPLSDCGDCIGRRVTPMSGPALEPAHFDELVRRSVSILDRFRTVGGLSIDRQSELEKPPTAVCFDRFGPSKRKMPANYTGHWAATRRRDRSQSFSWLFFFTFLLILRHFLLFRGVRR